MRHVLVRTLTNKDESQTQIAYPLEDYISNMSLVECIGASTRAMHISQVEEDLAEAKVVAYPDNDEASIVYKLGA